MKPLSLLLAAFYVGVAFADQPVSSLAQPVTVKAAGVHELTQPVVLSQRVGSLAFSTPLQTDPKIKAAPCAELIGAGPAVTVLRFPKGTTGKPLISNAGLGTAIDAFFSNSKGNTCFCPTVSNLAVDGQAGLHNEPYYRNSTPDLYGPDFVPTADGVSLQGTGIRGEHLRLFQIPGTALVMRGGGGGNYGQFCAYDYATSRASDVEILNCYAGIDDSVGDSRAERIAIAGVAKDGVVASGPGTYLDDIHVWGADRGAVFSTQIIGTNLYLEASRIGLHVLYHSDGSEVDGLNIGPGTCWERGALIESDEVAISRLKGTVRTDTVGVEIKPYRANVSIQGRLGFSGPAIGILLAGHNNCADLSASSEIKGTTFVKVVQVADSLPTKIDVRVRGFLGAGVALDLSESGLDKAGGQGNKFDVKCNGNGTPVIYPGGGTKYNLAEGNTVLIDDEVQK